MCEELDIYESVHPDDEISFDYSNVTYALAEYLELESDTIKWAFDNALKLKDSDDVIYTLSTLDQTGAKLEEILTKLIKIELRYTLKITKVIIEKLLTEEFGELLKYDEDSHKYSFSDPFYRTFALAFFKEKDSGSSNKRLTRKEMEAILDSAFLRMRGKYSVNQSVNKNYSTTSNSNSLINNHNTLSPNASDPIEPLAPPKPIKSGRS
jgi:hypothetical protein